MTKQQIVHVLCFFVALSLLAACGPTSDSSPDLTKRQTFGLQIAGEEGTQVHWEAYTDRYQPGATETMHIAVSNNADQSWHGHLCVQLLKPNPSSAVFLLAKRRIDLESGTGFDDTVSVVMPGNLLPGTYGLALVVHRPDGPAVDIVSIQVGEGSEEGSTNPWPTDAALRACPPTANSD